MNEEEKGIINKLNQEGIWVQDMYARKVMRILDREFPNHADNMISFLKVPVLSFDDSSFVVFDGHSDVRMYLKAARE
ncbi:MAG: hypothetical protein DRO99_01340 [Candidatus Aenigmatarchaeota archaeon]|nr:MAG: hypothetical protein DRO99_01340 [Candidatus Aenigmarchaeota archaeon]